LRFSIIFIRQKLNIVFIESNIKFIDKINIKVKIKVEILKDAYFFTFNTSFLSKKLLLSLIILY